VNNETHTLRLPEPGGLSFHMAASEFDALVDKGIEVIIIITPKRRYIASVDDWLDYGYHDLEGDEDIIVLNKSYMGT
jgi:hypothetical protein